MLGLQEPTLPVGKAKVYENGTFKSFSEKPKVAAIDPKHERLKKYSAKQEADAASRYRNAFKCNRGIATASILAELMGILESSAGKWLNANPDLVIPVGRFPDNQRIWKWIGDEDANE
jgi:hypothetical protein